MALYLVTGGAGFIGSNIVEELLRRGERVRVLDNFCTGKPESLDFVREYQSSSFELIEGDVRNLETCRRACQGVDYVLHQAALCSVPRSVNDPTSTNEVNITGTLNILLAAKESGVKRVVYASSSSVYGNSTILPLKETQPPSPISPYAASKLAGEYYCRVFSTIYGLETVSLRYFNVFGPRQDPESEYAAVIPRFILLALQGKPLEVHGDGLQSRDFTYISNVVEANLLAATSANTNGEALNIGTGQRYTVLEIAKAISDILGKELSYYHTPPRKGDVRHTQAEISQAQKLLGYRVRVGFEEGLKKTVDYFRKG